MTRIVFFILTIFLSVPVFSQSTISGKITDATGEPLVGVTVSIKGTSTGTISDIEGFYQLNAEQTQTLLFSMVGMETQEVNIANRTVVDVIMAESTDILQEVVVTGFQQVDRKLFTGSSENLKMDNIAAAGMTDISRVLEGQAAGVNVDNVSGTFGSSPKIRIRGNASINGNNQPLFVVDGVILEDLTNVNTEDFISGNANTLISSSVANINPDDIESFQILKDASATAIYGARAANGVIVITTKRGRSGGLQVSYSGNYSAKLRPTYNQFSLLNSAEEMSVYRELFDKGLIDISTSVRAQNYGALGKMFSLIASHDLDWGPGGTLNEEFLNQYENTNTDWFDELFRDVGLQQQHSLSFTTGSEKATNYFSVSYLEDQGQTIADKVQRFTGTSRNTYFISDKFSFGLKLTGSYRDQKVPGTRNRELDPLTGRYNRSFDINPFSYALNTARSIRPYDDNGDLEYFRRNYAPFNIINELDRNFIDINVVDLSAQTDFEFTPIKDISIKGVLQGRFASTERDHTVHEKSNQAEAYRANQTQFIQNANNLLFPDPDNPGLNPKVVLPQGGFKYLDQSQFLNFFSRISAEWNRTFNSDHEVNVLAGQEVRLTNRSSNSTTGIGVIYESGGIVVTDPDIIEFFNQQNIDYFSLNEEKDRFIGLFLNGGYAYKGKYIGNFTARYDGSNQLGESDNARFLPTWNVSGAWNAHEESFLQGINFLDLLKLRATYGISGNLPPQASAILNLQADVTVRPTDVEPYLFIQNLTNSELTWEKLNELNLGLDFGVFDNRISGFVNVYERKAYDLIGIVQTSGIGGEGLKIGNFADMKARGYEVSISTLNYKNNQFSWSTNFNLGYTKDEITKLDFGPRIVDAIGQNGAAVIGGPRRGLYSAQFAGLNTQGLPTFIDGEGETVFQYDLQEREGLRETLQFEGSTEPLGSGGFTNTFNYKNFTFSFLISFKYGYKIRLNDAIFSTYTDFDALPAELANRWIVPGDEEITNIPVILDRGIAQSNGNIVQAYELYNKSTVRVADGDYARLKNVRLSYALPASLLKKVGIRSAACSIEGQNLALLYSDDALNGQDPEFFTTGGVALPQPKLITLSLNLGF
ncbi:SusC/RagA family TonB-linked outer membrane protein [Fulvivirga lutimaris]|uniref:SusC/RagA family TonB-linked outer membrane protein n=1 Tax=Fulvivirga lutimaris TaxID=1819566 RepID=UPI0012BBBB01|nr:SusC/RagA family TonB-linked outer membrane protein [Fulvivirga lutimaris]MTI39860.1 SusC/RagA family TonB-linked outer membrane protein [Fulvivirga lutimaris]